MTISETKIKKLAKVMKFDNGICDFKLLPDEIRHDEYRIIYDDGSEVFRISMGDLVLSARKAGSVIDLISNTIY